MNRVLFLTAIFSGVNCINLANRQNPLRRDSAAAKNYNMSMKEIWLIFIPLLITLAGSIAVNIIFLANAKKIKKWHYSLFVFLDFIAVVWLFMSVAG